METPVLLIIFNRLETTQRVFSSIREAKPLKLFIAADGPRPEKEGEAEKCVLLRQWVLEHVDWNCELKTLFSEQNLGCGIGPAQAITWFFNHVEQGIILEDDCLPAITFFAFCEELLNKYKDDERIMMISGTNVLGDWKSGKQSYHFSYYGGIWGWASWRRAWKHYDYNMKLWSDKEVQERIKDVIVDSLQYKFRFDIFSKMRNKPVRDIWDYQWGFARLSQSGLSIVPSVNLISNIGFGSDATHTHQLNSPLSSMPIGKISFPIIHNQFVMVDRVYDKVFMEKQGISKSKSVLERAINKIFRIKK